MFVQLLCTIAAICASEMFRGFKRDRTWYLNLEGGYQQEGFVRFFTWLITFSQMVPISLTVSGDVRVCLFIFYLFPKMTSVSDISNSFYCQI